MTEDAWLLTDEEIKDIIGERPRDYAVDAKGNLKILALIQDAKTKRKLIEWIASLGDYSLESPVNTFRIPEDEWEALRRELGIGL